MPPDVAALLDRVERAQEGSRELDLAVWNHFSKGPEWRFTDLGSITCDRYGPGAAGNPVCSLTEFTTSIDGAVELIEFAMPGASWSIRTTMEGGYAADLPFVKLRDMHPTPVCARTAPLTLIAALLHAHNNTLPPGVKNEPA